MSFEGSQVAAPSDVLVDADGGLADVLVRLTRVQAEVPAPPEDPLVFVIEDAEFRPHVAGIQVGRTFGFDMRGPQADNPNWRSRLNPVLGSNITSETRLRTTTPEVTRITCDIHPWSLAHLVIVEHPWFAVSASDGAFSIEAVPPGTYGLEAWHAELGTQDLGEVTVSVGTTAQVEVTFEP